MTTKENQVQPPVDPRIEAIAKWLQELKSGNDDAADKTLGEINRASLRRLCPVCGGQNFHDYGCRVGG